MPTTLNALPLHSTATVDTVGGDRAFRRRLLELGILPGTVITVRRVAPLGDPIELEVRSSRISIRRREALAIHVR